MLLEFSVGNYMSYKDQMTLSMVASKDKSQEYNLIKFKKMSLLRSAIIYGPNASGKSNLLRSMSFVKYMIRNSHKFQRGDKIKVRPFKLDDASSVKPSSFEIVFVIEGIKYEYGFSADINKVYNEYLYHYPKGRRAIIFERDNTGLYKFISDKKEQHELSKRTPDNALYLSTSSNWNYEKTSKIMGWFADKILIGSSDESSTGIPRTIESFNKNEDTRGLIKRLLYETDIGIVDLDISVRDVSDTDLPSDFPDPLREYILKEKAKVTKIQTYHCGINTKGDKIKVPFEMYEESGGSQKMFELAGFIIDALLNGSILIIDEFKNLHPHLIEYIIKLFHDPTINKNNSQLICSTHNTHILNTNILRRDQIWFTEKKSDQSTELYSLWDYKARKDENIERRYLAGRYGAIPFLGEGNII